jgi:CheY-like chemotaxis protein
LPPPFSNAAIYACSSSIDPNIRQDCRDAGMDGCLLKPLRHADLDDLLQRATAGRHADDLLVTA